MSNSMKTTSAMRIWTFLPRQVTETVTSRSLSEIGVSLTSGVRIAAPLAFGVRVDNTVFPSPVEFPAPHLPAPMGACDFRHLVSIILAHLSNDVEPNPGPPNWVDGTFGFVSITDCLALPFSTGDGVDHAHLQIGVHMPDGTIFVPNLEYISDDDADAPDRGFVDVQHHHDPPVAPLDEHDLDLDGLPAFLESIFPDPPNSPTNAVDGYAEYLALVANQLAHAINGNGLPGWRPPGFRPTIAAIPPPTPQDNAIHLLDATQALGWLLKNSNAACDNLSGFFTATGDGVNHSNTISFVTGSNLNMPAVAMMDDIFWAIHQLATTSDFRQGLIGAIVNFGVRRARTGQHQYSEYVCNASRKAALGFLATQVFLEISRWKFFEAATDLPVEESHTPATLFKAFTRLGKNPAWARVAAGVAALVTIFGVVAGKHRMEEITSVMDGMLARLRTVDTFSGVIGCIYDTVTLLGRCVSERSLEPLLFFRNPLDAWVARATSFTARLQEIVAIQEAVNDIDAITAEFHQLNEDYATIRATCTTASLTLPRLASVHKDFVQRYNLLVGKIRGTMRRVPPFTLMLVGPPGTGKTTLTDNLNIWACRLEKIPKPSGTYMWTYTGDTKYCDGANNSIVTVLIDDAAKLRPEKVPMDPTPGSIISIVNNAPWLPNMAAVEEKGTVVPTPKLCLVSTNTEHLNAHHFLSNTWALMRRFNFIVKARVRDECRMVGSDGLPQNRIDPNRVHRVPGRLADPCVYDIFIREPRGTDESSFVDRHVTYCDGIESFHAWFNGAYQHHHASQQSMLDATRVDAVRYCDTCNLTAYSCVCGADQPPPPDLHEPDNSHDPPYPDHLLQPLLHMDGIAEDGEDDVAVEECGSCLALAASPTFAPATTGLFRGLVQAFFVLFSLAIFYRWLVVLHRSAIGQRFAWFVTFVILSADYILGLNGATDWIVESIHVNPGWVRAVLQGYRLQRFCARMRARQERWAREAQAVAEQYHAAIRLAIVTTGGLAALAVGAKLYHVFTFSDSKEQAGAPTVIVSDTPHVAATPPDGSREALPDENEAFRSFCEQPATELRISKHSTPIQLFKHTKADVYKPVPVAKPLKHTLGTAAHTTSVDDADRLFLQSVRTITFRYKADDKDSSPEIRDPTQAVAHCRGQNLWVTVSHVIPDVDCVIHMDVQYGGTCSGAKLRSDQFVKDPGGSDLVIFPLFGNSSKTLHALDGTRTFYLPEGVPFPLAGYYIRPRVAGLGGGGYEVDAPRTFTLEQHRDDWHTASADGKTHKWKQTVLINNGKPTSHGDCGSLAVVTYSGHRWIAGIHHASRAGVAMCVRITPPILDRLVLAFHAKQGGIPRVDTSVPILEDCTFRNLHRTCYHDVDAPMVGDKHVVIEGDGSCQLNWMVDSVKVENHGDLRNSDGTHVQSGISKSDVIPTMFADYFRGVCGWTTDKMAPILKGNAVKQNALRKARPDPVHAEEGFLEDIAESYTECMVQELREKGLEPGARPLTYKEAIMGVPGSTFLNPMDLNKSAGYPYGCSKRKIMDVDEDGVEHKLRPDTMARIERAEAGYQCGQTAGWIFKAMFKDEPRAAEKVKAKRTRTIFAAPIEFTILFRRYFSAIIALLQLHRGDAYPNCPGVNAEGPEWGGLYDHLYDKCFDSDYADYDFSVLTAKMMRLSYAMLIYLACTFGEFSDADVRTMLGLAQDACNCFVDFFGYLLRFLGVNPSGQGGTTTCNGLVNQMTVCAAFVEHRMSLAGTRDKRHVRPLVRLFFKVVHMLCYGDDLVVSVSPGFYDFTFRVFKRTLENWSIKVTPGLKHEADYDLKEKTQIDFLKRRFVKGADGFVRAPLRDEVIHRLGLVTMKSTITQEAHHASILMAMHRMAAQCDEAVFDWYDQHIRAVADRYELMPHVGYSKGRFPTYHEYTNNNYLVGQQIEYGKPPVDFDALGFSHD